MVRGAKLFAFNTSCDILCKYYLFFYEAENLYCLNTYEDYAKIQCYGMTCINCKKRLLSIDGIFKVSIELPKKEVCVVYDSMKTTETEIIQQFTHQIYDVIA